MADERTRYSDAELEEFKQLLLKKLENARADYELLRATITHTADNDTEDTSPTFKVLEEGATTLSKEESGRLAAHQMKFIRNLEMALVRIENKTYGICKTTGKLIPKERLMRVPHATECIEGRRCRSLPGREAPPTRPVRRSGAGRNGEPLRRRDRCPDAGVRLGIGRRNRGRNRLKGFGMTLRPGRIFSVPVVRICVPKGRCLGLPRALAGLPRRSGGCGGSGECAAGHTF